MAQNAHFLTPCRESRSMLAASDGDFLKGLKHCNTQLRLYSERVRPEGKNKFPPVANLLDFVCNILHQNLTVQVRQGCQRIWE